MASIKVTLELDDKGYIQRIKAAEKETANLGKTAATAGAAGAAGTNLLTTSMVALRGAATAAMTALAPLLAVATAFAAIKSSITLANDIDDLAQGSGIAAEKIIALRTALRQAGGDGESAANMITKLTTFLDDAIEGSDSARKRFAELGISLEDLATKSPDELLDATVQGLAAIEDPIKRNAIAFELLGKRAANIEWDKVARGTANVTDEQRRQADTAAKVAEATERFENVMENLQLGLMELLDPFADLIDSMGGLNNLASVGSVIFKGLQIVFSTIAVTAFALYTTIDSLIGGLKALYGAGAAALTGDFGRAADVLSDYASETKQNFADVVNFAQQQYNRLAGIAPPAVPGVEPSGRRTLGVSDSARQQADQQAKQAEREHQRDLDRARDLIVAIDAQTASLKAKYETELQNIGLSQDQIRLNNELAALEEKRAADLAKIAQAQTLTAQERLDAENSINASYDEQRRTVEENLQAIQASNLAETNRLEIIKEQIDAIQTRNSNIQRSVNLAIEELALTGRITQRQKDNIIELDTLESTYRANRQAAQAELDAAIEQSERDKLNRYIERLDEQFQHDKRYIEERQALEERRRGSFLAGTVSVFENLAESLTPFQVAADATNAVFGNLENAISEFARTGKLNFGEFAKSVIRDLIAITLRTIILRTILSAFGGIFGGGGGAAAGTQLPAMADTGIRFAAAGGPIRANQGYIVGERGPEYFMPNTSGTMIPNDKLGSLGGTTVNYNIQAVDAASFKQLVARDPEFIYSVTQVGARRLPR